MNMRELLAQRARLIAEARTLNETAEKENRDLAENEATRYTAIMAEIDQINGRMERGQRLANLESAAERGGERQIVDDGNIGMTRDELRQYSIVRAINAAAKGDWRGAEVEKAASDRVAARSGKVPKGFWVPQDVLQEKRDLLVGTPSAGGFTVQTDVMSQSFIELLRHKMMVRAAGASVIAGLVGDVSFPRQTGGATAYWVNENVAVTESQQTFGQVTMAPKTIGAFTDLSRKLLKQSSIDIEAFVRNDLATVLALGIDLAALHGSGAGAEPMGIASTAGIGSVAGGDNGAAPTWANIVGLETAVATADADIGRMAYMTNAKVRGKLKTTQKVATYGNDFIWGDGPTPLNGYPAYATNQVSSALTKGTATTGNAIFFGNWADLLIGMWGGLDVLVDPYTGGTAGTVRVIAMEDVDIAVRHAGSFAAMLDALTV